MKQTKTLLALGAMLLSCGAALAQSDLLIVASPPDGGEEQTVPVYVGTTMKFTPQGVEIDGSESSTFSWGTFTTLSFRVGTTGIADITTSGKLHLVHNPAESMLEFTGYDGGTSTLVVTDLNGRCRITINGWRGENVNISSLAPGMYFVTINKETIKFIKK